MNKQQIAYINPRLAILSVPYVTPSKNWLLQIELTLKSRHKQYFHLFNLSSLELHPVSGGLGGSGVTNFKWRGITYSLTQAIKLISSIQNYQSKNMANAAILVAADLNCLGFCHFVCQLYYYILNQKVNVSQYEYNLGQFVKIYKTISIKNPPVKILDCLQFKYPDCTFVPIIKIFSQSRHNNFEQVYWHYPEAELSKYYIDKKSPLASGTGLKYCQKKPETKHFIKPVVVCGDVKIQIYSYETLKLQKQFTIGFNTKALEYDQTLVQFSITDMYELASPNRLGSANQQVLVQVSDYCEKCPDQAKCSECIQFVKKFGNTYTAAQVELEKIVKNRSADYVTKIIGS